ncbi:MAG: glycine zipper 2TM domain-containing protein [Burkholderiaceae bacterium]|nr:glycine zipper 2TM domain-containing protein [Burkholderiaceae bacterium]
MNKSMLAGIAVGAAAVMSVGAYAGYRSFTGPAYAEVVAVAPVKRVETQRNQECATVPVTRRREVKDENRIAGTAVGAVVGGIVGHQIGGGRGRDLATVAGAVGGGYAGNRIQKGMQERDTYTTEERRCKTVEHPVERVIGYDVKYTLGGKTGTVRMDHAPAERIPVRDGKLVLDAPASAGKS